MSAIFFQCLVLLMLYSEIKKNEGALNIMEANKYKESMMIELIELTKYPKVSSRGTEIESELKFFYERKRTHFIWNIKKYIPNQISYRSR